MSAVSRRAASTVAVVTGPAQHGISCKSSSQAKAMHLGPLTYLQDEAAPELGAARKRARDAPHPDLRGSIDPTKASERTSSKGVSQGVREKTRPRNGARPSPSPHARTPQSSPIEKMFLPFPETHRRATAPSWPSPTDTRSPSADLQQHTRPSSPPGGTTGHGGDITCAGRAVSARRAGPVHGSRFTVHGSLSHACVWAMLTAGR